MAWFELPSRRLPASVNGRAPPPAKPVVVDAEAAFDEEMRARWRLVVRLLVAGIAVNAVVVGVATWYLAHRLDVLATYVILGRK